MDLIKDEDITVKDEDITGIITVKMEPLFYLEAIKKLKN